MNDYGNNIKIARKKANLTQKELAEISGVAKITIQQYEAGKRQPRLEQIEKLANALMIDVSELLGMNTSATRNMNGQAIENDDTFLRAFLNEAGYEIFFTPIMEYRNDKIMLYDWLEKRAYYLTQKELSQIKENVITYARFQINDFIHNNESIYKKNRLKIMKTK